MNRRHFLDFLIVKLILRICVIVVKAMPGRGNGRILPKYSLHTYREGLNIGEDKNKVTREHFCSYSRFRRRKYFYNFQNVPNGN